jgi:SMC interacting uncharacterized protein involved in chromosome segregation
MTGQQKKQLRYVLDRKVSSLNSHVADRDRVVDEIIDELEKMFPDAPLRADPLGADRKAREI